jgi:hypothetical protein
MRPSILIIVTSDPRISGRPAEAVRVAAGVGTWRKAEITLYLHGSAIAGLGEWVDELVDDDNFTRYLPVFAELKRPVLVERGHPALAELGETTIPWEEIGRLELAGLARNATYTLRF